MSSSSTSAAGTGRGCGSAAGSGSSGSLRTGVPARRRTSSTAPAAPATTSTTSSTSHHRAPDPPPGSRSPGTGALTTGWTGTTAGALAVRSSTRTDSRMVAGSTAGRGKVTAYRPRSTPATWSNAPSVAPPRRTPARRRCRRPTCDQYALVGAGGHHREQHPGGPQPAGQRVRRLPAGVGRAGVAAAAPAAGRAPPAARPAPPAAPSRSPGRRRAGPRSCAAIASVAPGLSGASRVAGPPSATTSVRAPSGSWSRKLAAPLTPPCRAAAPASEVSRTSAVASSPDSTGAAVGGDGAAARVAEPERRRPAAPRPAPAYAGDEGDLVAGRLHRDHRHVGRGAAPGRPGRARR